MTRLRIAMGIVIVVCACAGCGSEPEAVGLGQDFREAQASPNMQRALSKQLTVNFEDMHLSEITEFLGDYAGVTIALDREVIGFPNEPMPAGAVTDGVVKYVNFQGIPLRLIIQGLVTPLDLDYVVVDEGILISTRERIEAAAAGE